ncbi:MAG: porin family protein [Bacteroidia bacterium]|nr:PorT family protein [Bacteroidia bacterium]MDW8158191.1 porin family protein [Bacteroidia bacterium]
MVSKLKKLLGWGAIFSFCLSYGAGAFSQKKSRTDSVVYTSKYPLFSYGMRIGFNLAAYRGVEVKNANTHPGFMGGTSLTIRLNPKWAIQPELLFSQKSASALYIVQEQNDTLGGTILTTVRNDARLNFSTIDLPLLVKYYFASSPQFSAFFSGGAFLSYTLGFSVEGISDVYLEGDLFNAIFGRNTKVLFQSEPIDARRFSFSKFDCGFVVGGGSIYNLGLVRLTFDIRYAMGVPDIDHKPTIIRTGAFICLVGIEF